MLIRFLFCCVVLLTAGLARSETRLYIDQVAPMAYTENGDTKGLLADLLGEMARHAERQAVLTPLPLVRLRVSLAGDKQALGTLWRIPELEHEYRWWFKLLDAKFCMLAAPNSKHDISSVEAARDLQVGVVLGSPAELMARRAGFKNIQVSSSPESIAKKLALGRIDIWIGTPRVVRAVYPRMGLPVPQLRVGHEVGALGLYLASAPGFSQQEVGRWQTALETMKKDGSYAAILTKYPDSFQ